MIIELTTTDFAWLVLATVVALGVPLLGAWRGKTGGFWGPGIGLGAGYFAFQYGIARPAFPPSDAGDRPLWLGLVAMLLCLFESIAPSPAWTRWENRLLMTWVIVAAILGPTISSADDFRAESIRILSFTVGFLVSWANIESLARRLSCRDLAPNLLVVCSGAAVVFLLSGWAVGAQLAGGLGAILGLIWVISCFATSLRFEARGDTGIRDSGRLASLRRPYLFINANLEYWPAYDCAAGSVDRADWSAWSAQPADIVCDRSDRSIVVDDLSDRSGPPRIATLRRFAERR